MMFRIWGIVPKKRQIQIPKSDIPSGDVKIAIENDHRNSGFSQLENGDFPVRYVKLPEGIIICPDNRNINCTTGMI